MKNIRSIVSDKTKLYQDTICSIGGKKEDEINEKLKNTACYNKKIYLELMDNLEKIEREKPVFARTPKDGLSNLLEHLGNLANAINHGTDRNLKKAKARNLLTAAWQFYLYADELFDHGDY